MTLMVVLILLIAMTLLGLVALRGTMMEERMSAAMFDRSLAFQAAESALRLGEQKVAEAARAGHSIGVDCSAGAICPSTPAGIDVASKPDCSPGTPGCWISVTQASSFSAKAAAAPQYYIEFMGDIEVSDDEAYSDRGASALQIGVPPPTRGKSIYRVSARSGNPRGDRAVVALQATMELH